MQFKQKLKGRVSTFNFTDKYVEHSFEDSNEAVSFKVPYDQIDVEYPISLTDKNIIWKFVAIPFVFLAIFALGKLSMVAESMEQTIAGLFVAGFWVLLALGCLMLHRRSNVSFTMLSSSKGRIVLIHDGQQNEILDTIEKHCQSAI